MVSTGFALLDTRSGGLEQGRDYLVYGEVGTGKSSFALGFLAEGLANGERAALLTRRSAPLVLEHARALGWDLKPFIERDQLIIFEYVDKIFEHAHVLADREEILIEFKPILKSSGIKRLVIDPIVPLLASTNPTAAAFRGRMLTESLAELGSTNLYLLDLPEGAGYIDSCKEFFHGVLRFDNGIEEGTGRSLTVERLSASSVDANERLQIESQGNGNGATQTPKRRILFVDSREHRGRLGEILSEHHSVSFADDMVEVMVQIGSTPPDLVIVDKAVNYGKGLELCRALRKAQKNMPIIVIGEEVRRVRDRVEILASGADAFVEEPVDARLLNLEISALFERGSRRRAHAIPREAVLASLKRHAASDGSTPESFYSRIEKEVQYSRDNGLSFVVMTVGSGSGGSIPEELVTACGSLIRDYDAIVKTPERLTVLLAETGEYAVTAFSEALKKVWSGDWPAISYRCYDGREDFLDTIKGFIEGEIQSEETLLTSDYRRY